MCEYLAYPDKRPLGHVRLVGWPYGVREDDYQGVLKTTEIRWRFVSFADE
jgi:hypothetical protein